MKQRPGAAHVAWMYNLGGVAWVVRAWGNVACWPAQKIESMGTARSYIAERDQEP